MILCHTVSAVAHLEQNPNEAETALDIWYKLSTLSLSSSSELRVQSSEDINMGITVAAAALTHAF